MVINIARRKFIAILSGGAVAWPGLARGQQPPIPVVGYLSTGTPESDADHVAAFRTGLSETGYVESRNVAIEYRWAENENNRLPALANEICRQRREPVILALRPAIFDHQVATLNIPGLA